MLGQVRAECLDIGNQGVDLIEMGDRRGAAPVVDLEQAPIFVLQSQRATYLLQGCDRPDLQPRDLEKACRISISPSGQTRIRHGRRKR